MSRFTALLACLASISTATYLKPNAVRRNTASTSSNTCLPAQTGPGPVATPDTGPGFKAFSYYGQAAVQAATPNNYQLVFQNLTASVSTSGYMGYYTLNSYSPQQCATICNQANGCSSINIYFERDPVVIPADGCQDPSSTVLIKCVLWSGSVSENDAVNVGQWIEQFHVLIAGSNAYTNIPSHNPSPTSIIGTITNGGSSSVSIKTTSSVSSSSSRSVSSSTSAKTSAPLTSSTTHSSSSSTSSSRSVFSSSLTTTSSTSSVLSTSSSTSKVTPYLVPTPVSSVYHPRATESPTMQWVNYPYLQRSPPLSLLYSLKNASYLLQDATNGTFQPDIWKDTSYFGGSGTIPLNSVSLPYLQNLTAAPIPNRDGTQGGVIGNTSIFWFCDTSVFTYPNGIDQKGVFQGMSANSIAVDVGRNAINGQAVSLQDPVGYWHNPQGWPRNAIPLTNAEATFNSIGLNYGRRYALWPQGGLVSYNNDSGLLFVQITYVDTASTMGLYQYAGSTVVNITIQNGEPIAQRLVPRLHNDTQPQFGTLGGFRSWGRSGKGSTDGMVYLFGNQANGLFITRTTPDSVANITSYQYWHNSTTGGYWDYNTPNLKKDYFIANPFGGAGYSSGNIVFSPYHGTFLFIFQATDADNTIWYKYLKVPQRLNPNYNTDNYVDIGEALTQYPWSATLRIMETPDSGSYTYDGGVHPEYFFDDDLVNGGTKMLVSWTAQAKGGNDLFAGGYNVMTAEVDWA